MKKIIATLAFGFVTSAAFAGGWASVDTEPVKGRDGAQNSQATYVRAGTEIGGLQVAVQNRAARFNDGTVVNSLEGTVGKSFGVVTPFVGVGHDNGGATTRPFNYGLVGAQVGVPVGPGFALVGVKTRVRESAADPKQTVTYATYSVPVTKQLAVNLNVSRSDQTIKENAIGLGVKVSF